VRSGRHDRPQGLPSFVAHVVNHLRNWRQRRKRRRRSRAGRAGMCLAVRFDAHDYLALQTKQLDTVPSGPI